MESDGSMTDPTSTAADLAFLQADRTAMADRAMQPWWYDPLLGLLVSGLRPGKTQEVLRVWLVGHVAVLALAVSAESGLGWRGSMVVGGAVLGVGIALISRWWTRIHIAELRAPETL
jgi:hypothetical protein